MLLWPYKCKQQVMHSERPPASLLILLIFELFCSRGPTRRRASGSSPGAAGPSGWRRWCWGGSRCPTPSPFTRTLVPPSANTARGCSRVCFARACSAKVGLEGKRQKYHHPDLYTRDDHIMMSHCIIGEIKKTQQLYLRLTFTELDSFPALSVRLHNGQSTTTSGDTFPQIIAAEKPRLQFTNLGGGAKSIDKGFGFRSVVVRRLTGSCQLTLPQTDNF